MKIDVEDDFVEAVMLKSLEQELKSIKTILRQHRKALEKSDESEDECWTTRSGVLLQEDYEYYVDLRDAVKTVLEHYAV
jgi:hypothetical protein